MGFLKDSLITLENRNKIKIDSLKLNDDKLLSCKVEGLYGRSINKEAIIWSRINPKIDEKTSLASHKWKESIDKYIVVNGDLKISFDAVILFKDFEGETTWGYSKSLRKGYSLFTDRFEYEEIKSIKRVKENVDMVFLTVIPFSYYFVNGYLVHNTSSCDDCDLCHLWPAVLQHYGPHVYNSSSNPISTSYLHGYDQEELYGDPHSPPIEAAHTRSMSSYLQVPYQEGDGSWSHNTGSWSHGGSNNLGIPWNYFAKNMRLYNRYTTTNRPSGTMYYYVVKRMSNWYDTPTKDNTINQPGWVAFVGSGPNALSIAKATAADVPYDFWYYNNFSGGGSTNKTAQILYTGTAGAKWYSGIKSGSTITWSGERSTVAGTLTNQSSHSISINENTHGGRGESKVYVVFKIPVPPNNTTYVDYDLRWRFNNSNIDPVGWFMFRAYRAGIQY